MIDYRNAKDCCSKLSTLPSQLTEYTHATSDSEKLSDSEVKKLARVKHSTDVQESTNFQEGNTQIDIRKEKEFVTFMFALGSNIIWCTSTELTFPLTITPSPIFTYQSAFN
jgi:beta-glucanase (GH16 family)